ncbi:hypothetical protein CXG81DRAFT_28200 [Caulochytrium protostelioides]|uniref:DNA mismatch repair proteins mutS family domain-containing protein n=1 Tax=Caulochytrium protostelioides TaxID=1555241 RepID=A0A4V1IU18_9FUNG|nr:hypothetical protein CXG81DRAFT_28200 [Caulochytrium protostelioides]|eukprot:RKO99007.1 hypothetical protein CXG81DRAFT_28200 [Caulochytrium protostelioides]
MASPPARESPELALDKPAEIQFARFFRSLPQASTPTVRLFERNGGQFHTVHGDDACCAADHVYRTAAVLRHMAGDEATGLATCSLSKANAVALLKYALFEQLARVEVWAMPESAAAYGRREWRVVKTASPGRLAELEDWLYGAAASDTVATIMAVKVVPDGANHKVGIALMDATSSTTLSVAEFVDSDGFSSLEALMVQTSCREALIPDDVKSLALRRVRQLLEQAQVMYTPQKTAQFAAKDAAVDLAVLLGVEQLTDVKQVPIDQMSVALAAVGGLLAYLDLRGREDMAGQFTLQQIHPCHFMRLDSAAVDALHLFPPARATAAIKESASFNTSTLNKSASLYGLLNHCRTPQGNRLLSQWIRQPLLDLPQIEERMDVVEALVEETQLLQALHGTHLRMLPDLMQIGKKFHRGSATLQDAVRIYQAAIRLPSLLEAVADYQGPHVAVLERLFLGPIGQSAQQLGNFETMIERTIDLHALDRHEFLVKPDFDANLAQIAGEMKRVSAAFRPEAERVADALGFELDKKLRFEHSPIYGHHLRLTRTDATKLRNKPGYIDLATQKAGVLFTTKPLKALNEKHADLQATYNRLQASLVREILEITKTYLPVLEKLNGRIAHLDVLTAFAVATVRARIPYVRPQLRPCHVTAADRRIVLRAARHPCLEAQDGVNFIPNDVELDHTANEFTIITGPNAAGKSVYIRQIGVIVAMAQIGCFVPCRDAEITLVDAILARVGAGDSQLRGISTFMAEMLETASILSSATKQSLLIIDELGRGTSTYDGFGLAWAISEWVVKKIGSFALFATHFHELTALADVYPQIVNRHVQVAVTDDAMVLLYQVLPGICDQSFGIHVAHLARFPERVIELAKRKALELENFELSILLDRQTQSDDRHVTSEPKTVAEPASTSVAAKKQRLWKANADVIREGNDLIRQVLADFAAIEAFPDLSDDERQERIAALREKYADRVAGQPFCQEVLSAF